MTKTEIIEEAIEKAKDKGFYSLGEGFVLESSDYIISRQKTWDDDDLAKNIDFTTSPLWIVTDTGNEPIGVSTVEEILKIAF